MTGVLDDRKKVEKGWQRGKVTGLGDHIPEIVEIMKKRKIAVLRISDGSGGNTGLCDASSIVV